MSYIVSIKRPIQKLELLSAIEGNSQYKVVTETGDGIEIQYLNNSEKPEYLFLSQGEIQATSPSESTYTSMEKLAALLNAEVIGEEDKYFIPSKEIKQGIFASRHTWIGWPILVIVLTIMLIVKW